MRGYLALAAMVGSSACAPADSASHNEMSADTTGQSIASLRRAAKAANPAAMPLSADLQRGIGAVAEFEVEGKPCLARPFPRLEQTPTDWRRQREIQSDSHWLNRHLHETFPERLNFSGLDARGPQSEWRHLVRLTGSDPIPPLRLRDWAADIPVVIEYDAPWSLAEVLRRRSATTEALIRLVPDLNGSGYHEYMGYGAVSLDVYSEDSQPDEAVLAKCDALRRLLQLPVIINFEAGRITAGPGYE